MIGRPVVRIKDNMRGVVDSFCPEYKGSIVIKWENNTRSGWYDLDGTDGKDKIFNFVES